MKEIKCPEVYRVTTSFGCWKGIKSFPISRSCDAEVRKKDFVLLLKCVNANERIVSIFLHHDKIVNTSFLSSEQFFLYLEPYNNE